MQGEGGYVVVKKDSQGSGGDASRRKPVVGGVQ